MARTCPKPKIALCGAALLACMALATACASLHAEAIAGAPPGTIVLKVAGRPAAHPATDPQVLTVSESELQTSLRSITVRYIKYTRVVLTDPRPLLSDEQVTQYAAILARELPKLTPTERLRFTFQDRYLGPGAPVDMEVYRDGNSLMFWFNALAADENTGMSSGLGEKFRGFLEPSVPGQKIVNQSTSESLAYPLLGSEREKAAELDAKQRLFSEARTDALFDPAEAATLEPLIAQPKPTLDAWKAYWDKRRTLKKALDQDLIDREAYRKQSERLNRELLVF
jgi:hypothetical protein